MIEIREVKSRKEINNFINFPIKLYKGNENFVPALRTSELDLFKKNNCFASSSDTLYINAYKDGKMVGRISGIIQKDANEKWNQKRVRFTRFDSIDDQEVANALFDYVSSWAKEKGMTEIVGPLGFNDLEREGLLVEGFDKLATFEEQYNFAYYQTLIENYGFIKDADWIEQEVRQVKGDPEQFIKVSNYLLKRAKLKVVIEKSVPVFVKKHRDEFFELLEDTYSNLYGTVPIRKEVQDELIKGFKLLLKSDNVVSVVNENNEMICFAIFFPSIAKAVNKSKGRLLPTGLFRILHAINHPKILDFGLIGVRDDYKNLGVPSMILMYVVQLYQTGKYDHFETNLTLEDNEAILGLFKRFETVQHKRRRSYKKDL